MPYVQNVHVALGVSTSDNPVTIPFTNLEDLDANHVIEVTKHSAKTIYVDTL
ncbi:hypothetical protein [Sharpea azabuensis]|uniref:hypothetical protein n=1 Tax=Sharpea azabuensis TaxID=322505 RepID=UPI0015696E05|nr:hypothetical protein [Sharpea azabuensis]